MKLTHNQLGVLRDRTAGYAQADFDIEVSATGQAYLTVYSVVYTIDPDGFFSARRKQDGNVIYQADPYQARG